VSDAIKSADDIQLGWILPGGAAAWPEAGVGVNPFHAIHAGRSGATRSIIARVTAREKFRRERSLPNGWVLNTKEELMYYRVFEEQLGEVDDLLWMGRTKGAPRH
jgi:hypothetical protein